MKKQLYMVVTIIALLTVSGLSSVKAQTRVLLKARIPFEFSVGNQTMPAGEYTVRCMNSGSDVKVLQILGSDGRESVLVRTNSISGKIQDNAKLVFDRYGDRYFFAQAWLSADSIGMQAPQSRTERHLARELAANKQARETVAVIAKR